MQAVIDEILEKTEVLTDEERGELIQQLLKQITEKQIEKYTKKLKISVSANKKFTTLSFLKECGDAINVGDTFEVSIDNDEKILMLRPLQYSYTVSATGRGKRLRLPHSKADLRNIELEQKGWVEDKSGTICFSFSRRKNVVEKIVKPKKEYVYLMRNERDGSHKIGYSKNPRVRERVLQSLEPMVTLISAWNATMKEERILQKKFEDKCIRGEWYDLTQDDIKFIENKFANRETLESIQRR